MIKTTTMRQLKAQHKRDAKVICLPAKYPKGIQRPRTRADCIDGPRPCPWVGCRHHLYLEVTEKGGIKYNFPNLEPEDLPVSCSLDVAERGRHILEIVGTVLNLTRERCRQIEAVALRKLRIRKGLDEWNGMIERVQRVEQHGFWVDGGYGA